MRYFATASGPKVREAMDRGLLGQIVTPAAGNRLEPGREWCADNSIFADRYPGDEAFLAWLSNLLPAEGCRFVVAPDVVGDAVATLARSAPMLPRIRDLGLPVAFVAQDGLEYLTGIPWAAFDVLFIGGTTAWKLGPVVRGLVVEAKEEGKWVHMGRVNSLARLRYAQHIGCNSADGTFLAYGPDRNLPQLLGWLREVNDQGVLWEAS